MRDGKGKSLCRSDGVWGRGKCDCEYRYVVDDVGEDVNLVEIQKSGD